MNLVNTLRMYAEDMHSATGYSERSSAMSKAADMIEKFENMSACEACATIPSVMEYVQQLEQERDNLAAQNEALRSALEEVKSLIGETTGVYGLHLNGDLSPWAEIEQGGRFERLTLLDDALNLPNLAAEVLKRRDAEVREECAKVCESRYMGDNNREDLEAKRCAAAIRARSEKGEG